MLKKLLFLTVLCSAVLSAQSRVGPFDFPVWSPLDTLRAGSTSDTSNSNNGLNSIPLKANKWLNRWFTPGTDSLRNVNHGVFNNSLRSNGTLNVTGATVLGGALNVNGNSVFTGTTQFNGGSNLFAEGLRILEGVNLTLTGDNGVNTGAFSAGDLTGNRGWSLADLSGEVGLTNAAQAYPNVKNMVLSGQSTTIAPLKITSGTLLTTPQAGAVEFDGTYFYGTRNSGQRDTLNVGGSGSAGGGAAGGWERYGSSGGTYLSNIGDVVHLRAAAGDTTNTRKLNVVGTALITNTLRVGGTSATDSTLHVTGSGHFTTNLWAEGTITANLFSGSGASLTALNGSNVSSGTVSSDRLPVATTGTAGIVSASAQSLSGAKTFLSESVHDAGIEISAGAGLQLMADNATNFLTFGAGSITSNISWTVQNTSGTVALLNGGQTWSNTSLQTNFNADLLDGNSASAFASSSHNHAASNITSGTLSDSRLSSNIPRLNASNTWSGINNFDNNTNFQGIYNDGSLTVTGKATITGGVDPPYVSFTSETRQTIAETHVKDVKPEEEVMQFWNTETQRFEFYHLKKKKFFTFDGTEIILTQK